MYRKLTGIFLGIVIAVVIAYDVFVVVKGDNQSTISHVIVSATYEWPFLSFIAGVVCGHLFWRMQDDKYTRKYVRKDDE